MDENQKSDLDTKYITTLDNTVSTPKSHKRLQIFLIAYSCLIVLMLPLAIANDMSASDVNSDSSGSFLGYWINNLIIVLIVYFIRCFILIMPLRLKSTKWQPVTFFGLGFAALPEMYILFSSVVGVLSQPSCSSSGPFSSCGWSTLVFVPIIIFTALQVFGMVIGLIVSVMRVEKTDTKLPPAI